MQKFGNHHPVKRPVALPGIFRFKRPAAAAYTPGPWSVSKEGSLAGGHYWTIFGRDGYETARSAGLSRPTEEIAANARLIAAAPELLAALRAIVDRSSGRLYDTDQETGQTFDEIALAAIAKAGG